MPTAESFCSFVAGLRMHVYHMAAWLVLALVPACTLRFVHVDRPSLVAQHLQRIADYNNRVSQLRASLDIKGTGLVGSFVHEQADIIVRSPYFLFWALRSFFGSPAFVVATNGQYITMYDFLSEDHGSYQKLAMTNWRVFEMFGLSFHPKSLIDLLLAKVPLEGATHIEFLTRKDELAIKATLPGDWQVFSIFDTACGRLIETKLINESERVSYQAQYQEFAEYAGISFPVVQGLTVKNKAKSLKLWITFSNLELNGQPVDDHKFFLPEH